MERKIWKKNEQFWLLHWNFKFQYIKTNRKCTTGLCAFESNQRENKKRNYFGIYHAIIKWRMKIEGFLLKILYAQVHFRRFSSAASNQRFQYWFRSSMNGVALQLFKVACDRHFYFSVSLPFALSVTLYLSVKINTDQLNSNKH